MAERLLSGALNRCLSLLARVAPGATTLRVVLHRMRGVKIGRGVWIGYDAIIETSHPELVTIGDGAAIGIRATIVAHTRESRSVTICKDASIGIGAIVLPNVTVGEGAVVTPGSVVSRSVPPMTVVRGNPAVEVAKCGIVLKPGVTTKDFAKRLVAIGADHETTQGPCSTE